MKRLLFIGIALLTVLAFAGGSLAAEKKAAAKSEVTKVTGAVTTYIAAKQAEKMPGTISVKDAKGTDWSFDVLPDTKITGEVTRGVTATVNFKKEAGKMIANSITVAAVKKPAAKKTK
ncbi:MAG: hypothetical protein ACM34H_06550 [Deltaproteobacteria bacterium]